METYFFYAVFPLIAGMLTFFILMRKSLLTFKKEAGYPSGRIFRLETIIEFFDKKDSDPVVREAYLRHVKRGRKLMLFWILFFLLFIVITVVVGKSGVLN